MLLAQQVKFTDSKSLIYILIPFPIDFTHLIMRTFYFVWVSIFNSQLMSDLWGSLVFPLPSLPH